MPKFTVNGFTVNGPSTVTEVTVRGPGPRLLTVMLLVLVVPTWRVPKAVSAGRAMIGPVGATTTLLPVSGTVVVPPAALWKMLTVADLVPAAAGVKFTEMVHVPPTATVVQVVGTGKANSAEFVPPSATEVTTRFAVPVLLTKMDWSPVVLPMAIGPKVSDPGATPMIGVGVAGTPVPPIPWNVTTGLLEALVTIFSTASNIPFAVGANLIVRVQVPPTAIVPAQPPGSTLNGAVVEAEATVRTPGPLFVTVTGLSRVLPTARVPKSVASGVTATIGRMTAATPVPLTPTVPLAVHGYGDNAAVKMLESTLNGYAMGDLHLLDRVVPATPFELTLAIRACLSR